MPHYSVLRDNSIRLALQIRKKPFTDIGGYETFGVTDDGNAFCLECVRNNIHMHANALPNDGWMLGRIDCVCNYEGEIICDNCGCVIQSEAE